MISLQVSLLDSWTDRAKRNESNRIESELPESSIYLAIRLTELDSY